MTVGGMVWRTGPITGFLEQIAWFREQGLDGVAFHTGPPLSGGWVSFDVRRASTADRRALCEAVSGFREVSIHGEFDLYDVLLCSPNELVRRASVETLRPTLALAAEIGARVVTLHEGATHTHASDAVRREALARSLAELSGLVEGTGVVVGMELTRDYDLALNAGPSIGVTVDTGHVSMQDGAGYRGFGSIGGLIRALGERLVHMHVHDYDGRYDHLAIGAGHIDFEDVAASLLAIGYEGMLSLQLSPDATEPADYPRGQARLLDLLAACRRAPATP